jgi:hypothetical protein
LTEPRQKGRRPYTRGVHDPEMATTPKDPGISHELAAAAFALALRLTCHEERACACITRGVLRAGSRPGPFIRAVREEAVSAHSAASPPPAPPPASLAGISASSWDVLDRVALRGQRVSQVAQERGQSRSAAMLELHRALESAHVLLRKPGEPNDDPGSGRFHRLHLDAATHRLDDALHDGEAKTGALACLAA